MVVSRVTFALLAALALAAPARAADPADVSDARRLYAEGKAEYAQGHYDAAIALFERSYALSESSALLFNMAQAHRLAGPEHCSSALSLYKSYLAAEPEAENRREVEERIQELGECPRPVATASMLTPPAAAEPAAPPAPPPAPAPAPRNDRGLPAGPVITSGAGAALLVAGGVLYARAWDKHREAERDCPCYPGTYSNWEVLTNVSYALLAVGGATLVGGVSWWIVASPEKDDTPSQALLGVSGRF